ncbi:FixH family protein [Geomonas sp. RF6]|uniref:FixH family protein n=1 Tax=Geomonas sp. RF6 TaxID=2897342 RepID=UPI001E5A6692|nr:FixH family protein [Geomonas sp. RF6]UFS71116.1 FixH family protein [Geomonas sp. RF6]
MKESTIPPFWRFTMGLMMGSLLVVSAGSFIVAVRHPAKVVDPHYYSHGLEYGREGGEARWLLDAVVTPDALEIRVTDEADAPVTGGVVACQVADAGAVTFTEKSPGVYSAPKALLPTGEVRAVVRFTKGKEHSTRRMVLIP